jgi:hypothetical protein
MPSKSQQSKRADMPKTKAIKEFWAPRLFSLRKILDVDEILDPWESMGGAKIETCFCCGATGILERAHIKALSLGGDNSVANIHLLCKKCHLDSENLGGDSYWIWFLSCERKDPLSHDYEHVCKSMGFKDLVGVSEYYLEKSGGDTESALNMFTDELGARNQ